MASKLLKQVSSASYSKNSPKIHSVPVETQKSSTSRVDFKMSDLERQLSSVVSSLRPPTSYVLAEQHPQQYQVNTEDVVKGNIDLKESSSLNVYRFQTGISQQEPVIISTSEFIPIYTDGTINETGKSLSLKETSKRITAKTSSVVFSNFPELNKQVNSNKISISEKINKESSFVRGLLTSTKDTINSLDIRTYQVPWAKVFSNLGTGVSISTFDNILKLSGYNSDAINKFSRTKIWQQSLVDIKRHYSTHSPSFASINPPLGKNDQLSNDPYKLNLTLPQGYRNIWVNTFVSNIPTVEDLTSPAKVTDNISILSGFSSNLYVNISGNQSTVRPVELSSFPYGNDISIVANILAKESSYTEFLKSNDSRVLLSKYSYTVQRGLGQENFQMWDYVIGTFTKSVLDLENKTDINSPNRSLVGFSSQTTTTNQTLNQVLTLENDFIENSNVTPGSYYYIDSCLSSEDGKNFSIDKLNSLINLTRSSIETCDLLIKLAGYEIKPSQGLESYGITEFYSKLPTRTFLTVPYIAEKLSTVYYVYQKIVNTTAEQVININTNYTNLLTETETIGYRLASLICKTAVEPYGPYVGNPARDLKSLLFILLSNAAIESAESRQTIGSQKISELKNQISQVLSSNSVQGQGDSLAAEIQIADIEGRTYPISFSSDNQTNSRRVTTNSNSTSNDYIKSVSGRLFSIDIQKGLWKDIVDLLKQCYIDQLFVDNRTEYTGLSKVAFMFAYFDLLLRVIAAQTPENLLGSYSIATTFSSSSTISTKGLLVGKVSKEQLAAYYNPYGLFYRIDPATTVYKIRNSIDALNSDSENLLRKTEVLKSFVSTIGKSLISFKDYLQKNFSSHLSNLNALFTVDSSLTAQQRKSLINSTFSHEQLKLFSYLSSEIRERIEAPYASTFTSIASAPNSPDIFPTNETDFMSFELFHSGFNSSEFYPAKGNNKKIITIGLPQNLMRSLYSSVAPSFSTTKAMRQGIIRIKVYKLDKLYPQVVYKPVSYLFDTNRFPTRVLSNWKTIDTSNLNLFFVPSKIVSPSGDVIEVDSYRNDFKVELYGNFLSEREKQEIYRNHSMSFLLQEYMRWFSEVHFDDSRYFNYSGIDRDTKLVNDQYATFMKFVREKTQTSTTPLTPSADNSIIGVFEETNQFFYTPITTSNKKTSNSQELKSTKGHTLNMTSTIKSYLRNETFLQPSSDAILSRVFYPKKFDRVFSLIIDSDDFYVDTDMTDGETLQKMVDRRAIIKINSSTSGEFLYKHRDTTPDDVTYDEFFISAEPYDYVEEEK